MITLITSKRTSQKAVRYRGTVLVETAIVLVLLLMLLLGTMGFGYLFLRAEQVTNAARHGARLACVAGLDDYTPVETRIDTYLDTQKLPHNPTTIEDVSVNGTAAVKATVYGKDLDILKLGNISFMGWFPNDFNASVIMAKEGP